MKIKHQQLSHALALAKFCNFHEAAADQHVSQPAFSRSIRNLEDSLGVKLFDRSQSGTYPTLYGERVLARAAAIVEESQELTREVLLLKGIELGSFSVGLGLFPAALSGSRAIGELARDHPQVEYRVTLTSWEDVANLVLSRQVDIGVGEMSSMINDARLHVESIGLHEFVFYHRRGHPLTGKKSVTKTDIDNYPFAMVRLPPRMAKIFPGKGKIEQRDGVKVPSIEVNTFSVARTIVMESDAVSVATPVQIEQLLRTGELEVISFHEPWMKLNYGFIHRKDRMLSPATELFMKHVRRIEQELLGKNESLIAEIKASNAAAVSKDNRSKES